MVDDNLLDKIPLLDIAWSHYAVSTRVGVLGTRLDRVLGFLDSLAIRIYDKKAHSSTPELGT